MVHSRGVVRTLWGVLVVALLGAIWQWWVLHQATEFNRALVAGEFAAAARHPSREGRLAFAYSQPGDVPFDERVRAYGGLAVGQAGAVTHAAGFNLANIYLRRAIVLLEEDAEDLAIPLLELAKRSYRDLLRDGDGGWDVRFNLELVLALLPDLPPQEADEEVNPERSSQAISAMPVEEVLP